MATASDVLNVARSQIGFYEGANNESPYGIWYGIPNAPYCAMGISWCFAQVGLSHLIAAQTPKGFSYNPAALPWFQRQGMVVNKMESQPGDLAFFDWNGDGIVDHVELVEASSPGGITTIGFNTGSPNDPTKEGCWQLHRNYLFIMAIVRPKYPVTIQPTVNISKNKKATAVVGATGTAIAGTTAALHGSPVPVTSNINPSPTPSPTAFYAPPFPNTANSFEIGHSNDAVLTIQKALVKKKLLNIKYATGTMNVQTKKALVIFDKKAGIIVKAGAVPQIVYDTLKGSL
jgi:CHAP domain